MIHREGRGILIKSFVILALANVLLFYLTGRNAANWTILGISGAVLITFALFFRNPKRHFMTYCDKIVAPVDGRVVVVEQVYEDEVLKKDMMQISVFMSPMNIHVTRYPVSGKVTYSRYYRGKHLVAWHPKSSKENERTTVVVDCNQAGKILYRQIAGAMARRIVNYAAPGKEVIQCEDSGFIKFGSRVDVLVPLDYEVCVKLGDRVSGGRTIIAQTIV